MYSLLKAVLPKRLKTKLLPIYIKWISNKNSRRISKDKKEIKKYKDIHKGERCFIIGNGPSLLATDLTKLQGEYTFGLNTIYEIYEETLWRPTYYFIQDVKVIERYANDLSKVEAKACFIPLTIEYKYGKLQNAICLKLAEGAVYPNAPHFSYDLTKDIGNGYTITYAALQMAIYMGFTEIYMIGMDHSFSVNMKPDGTIEHFNDVKKNHFGADYINEGGFGKAFYYPRLQENELAFETAKKYAEEKGVKIYNATRGGKLEVFERVVFDHVIEA